MTTSEMLDSLNAVYTQIRADQKKEEYDDILIAAEELTYFLRSVFWNCCQLERLNERTVRQCFFHETMSCAAYSTSVSNPSSNCAKLMLNSMCRR